MKIRGPKVRFRGSFFKEVNYCLNTDNSCPLGDRYIKI